MRVIFPSSLDVMDSVVRTHKLELDRIVSDSVDAQTSIDSCQENGPKLEAKFQFFQELRGYVRDLVECLNEKVCPFFVSSRIISISQCIM